VRIIAAGLLLLAPAAAQSKFGQLSRELDVAHLRAAVLRSGHIIWQNGKITVAACEEPVIAERIPQDMLDKPAPIPPGATIREVLENRADGTPGEEILENHSFFDALKPIAGHGHLPSALRFAGDEHEPLGWFNQIYGRQDVRWCHEPSVLIVQVQVPGEGTLALVVAGNAHLDDGNIARSDVALAFFRDVVGLQVSDRDELIAQALAELYRGQRDASAALVHQALDKFPELESTPDVTLLYLFAELRLSVTEASATAVLREHPSLPTAWFYYGQYLENSKRYREAAACFEKITMHQPPWHNWTVAAAKKELSYLKTY
jgi:tetratricopeptide (TPR) repeat protein